MAIYRFDAVPSGVTDQEIAAVLAAVQAFVALEDDVPPPEPKPAWLRAARLEAVGLKGEPKSVRRGWRV